MTCGVTQASSDKNLNHSTANWDLNVINESIKSNSIVLDGKRVKWCKDFESP